MKTFRLISLQIVLDQEMKDIKLEDGLIINKEEENNTWLVEAYISKDYLQFFKAALEKEEELHIEAVITKKENSPAHFTTKMLCVNEFEQHISILLEGYLRKTPRNFAETLLEKLLHEGLSGDELLSTFKEKMQNKHHIQRPK